MTGENSKILLLCISLCFSLYSILLGEIIFHQNGSAFKTCHNNGTFKQIFNTSLPICAEKCCRRRRCEIYMFHQGMRYCALKEHVDLEVPGDQEPVCFYNKQELLPLETIDSEPCFNHTSGANERCTTKNNRKYVCLKSECPEPNEINNAAVLSKTYDIGKSNRYKCKPGFRSEVSPIITCDGNASWTPTDFTCNNVSLTCPQPNQTYLNGDLTSEHPYGFYEGTVLQFTCRNGYHGNGKIATSKCKDGQWTPNAVLCCHDKSLTTLKYGDGCLIFFDAGIAHSRTDVKRHCHNIGGKRVWYSVWMHELMPSRSDTWILQRAVKSFLSDTWDFAACAAANGESVADNSLHVDDKVQEVVSNSWTGDDCWWGLVWAPGEPNGGDSENCIIVSTETFLFYDAPCEFPHLNVGFLCSFKLPLISS